LIQQQPGAADCCPPAKCQGEADTHGPWRPTQSEGTPISCCHLLSPASRAGPPQQPPPARPHRAPSPDPWHGTAGPIAAPSPCPLHSTQQTRSLVCPPRDANGETKVVASASHFCWSHAPKVKLIKLSPIFCLAGGSLLTPSFHKTGQFAPMRNPWVVPYIFYPQPNRGSSTSPQTSQGHNLGCHWSPKGKWERPHKSQRT